MRNRRFGAYVATTDPALIDAAAVCKLLATAHWAEDLTVDRLTVAIANSLPFALLDEGAPVAFGRIVTDRSTFAYLTDVIVDPRLRGRGLGQELVAWMLRHPDLGGVRRVTLLTRDAAPFYRKLGFAQGSSLVFMERTRGTAR